MENKNIAPPEQKKNSNLLWIIIIAVLAVGLAAVLIWQFQTKKNLNILLEEKEQHRVELQKELDVLMEEHELVKEEYGQLSDSLVVKDSVIQANAVEIKKLLNTQWEYYKVKKKLAQLQEIAQGYVKQMDSLYRVNDQLTEENIAMKRDITSLEKERDKMVKDQEVLTELVDLASVLKAYNLEAAGIRLKTGSNKEVVTDKTKRMEKIRVCFTLGENEIIEPGMKQIYVRIARPDKEILTKSKTKDYTFEYEGKDLQYSIMKEINYENQPQDLCLYWRKHYSKQEMQVGLYHVDVFSDGVVIGHTTFTLK